MKKTFGVILAVVIGLVVYAKRQDESGFRTDCDIFENRCVGYWHKGARERARDALIEKADLMAAECGEGKSNECLTARLVSIKAKLGYGAREGDKDWQEWVRIAR